jgi:hypothetical protein
MVAFELRLVELSAVDLHQQAVRRPDDVGAAHRSERNHEVGPMKDSPTPHDPDLPPKIKIPGTKPLHRPRLRIAFGSRCVPATPQDGAKQNITRHAPTLSCAHLDPETERMLDSQLNPILWRYGVPHGE